MIEPLVVARSTKRIGHWSTVVRYALARASSAIGRLCNLSGRYCVEGHSLKVPLSSALPSIRILFPQYGTNLARVASACAEKYPELSVIDVGANVGESVALIRSRVKCPVLCIEGNPKFVSYLRPNVRALQEVEIEESFLVGANCNNRFQFVAQAHGTGHLERREFASGDVPTATLEDVVIRHPRFASAKLIKIDTDGLDVEIILGARVFLERTRAALFFEYDPDLIGKSFGEIGAVFDGLMDIGYTAAMVWDNFGDFLLRTELSDRAILRDVHEFFAGRKSRRYADLCVLHAEDSDITSAIHAGEREFFRVFRGKVP